MHIANIADMLALHGRQRPWQTAIVHGSASMNYQPLDLQVSRRAAMLQVFGVKSGDIVGIALEDSIEHLLMLYAVARAGAVILPLDCRWKTFEKQRVAQHFKPVLVMVEPGQGVEGVHCIEANNAWTMSLETTQIPNSFPDGNRGLLMSLSSGTTGRPKGPMLTHQQLIYRFYMHWAELGLGSRERYINATPLYFGGGRAFSMSSLYAGSTVVLCPPPYTPAELVAEVAREGGCVDFFGTADDGVHLVEVALHDADAAHAGKRHFAQGGLGHIGLAVVFLDDPRFAQELGLEFIEIEHDGKAWTIADEDRDAVPRIDVPARAGHEDAALTLHALALVVGFSFKQLLIGEAAGENQQQDGEGEIEGNDSRVVTLMGLKESARVL